MGQRVAAAALGVAVATLVACSPPEPSASPSPVITPDPVVYPIATPNPSPAVVASPAPVPNIAPDPGMTRPDWIGTRILKKRPDGFGYAQPTPPELVHRAMPPRPWFADPQTQEWQATITAVPDYVLKRSTWYKGCPVNPSQLAYIRMTYWGFDNKTHMGEMLINASVAKDIVGVFHKLYDARYPIEEMRVWSTAEMNAPPTGDYNITDSYTCRPVATKKTGWSMHAYGLAIDLNPFQNPYKNGSLVVPELSGAYLDRTKRLPGMVHHGDLVWKAFHDIGWGWGGDWSSLKDYTHFSSNGH